ncbi:MAG: hypothetical protein G01um101448_1133 [Parcubacteria group bacterium Gr01-1014_48]|nr:MAG: hypothetical protein Greene041614_1027 [Parcubacteria group bacterium Greene0416_14]TSC71570.1 MAG: hypothetical protein G01um101448_1133 [Parcubacteria group bacterium Gr01-1014_48]TSC99797.1 MAG: hypothetical protein Greene101415_1080 [Parcubacteria group bacterium Greene1014_15]TSD07836.1 MAG: hypothetical protein Greene07144_670 [Parcubacteria group bacterium Greene0714_4]
MQERSDFRTLLFALCMRFVAIMLVCVFAENIAIWTYLLSPFGTVISIPQFLFAVKILSATVFLAFAGVVVLAFLEQD